MESLKFLGSIFVNCWVFFLLIRGDLISLVRQFSILAIMQYFLSFFFFAEDVNSWGRAAHKYNKKLGTTHFNDSTVSKLMTNDFINTIFNNIKDLV